MLASLKAPDLRRIYNDLQGLRQAVSSVPKKNLQSVLGG
jgi:hypothetical protein